ncbi:MAG: Ig-like domain-containing protein [Candidatus Limnocylindria bacterium]
MAAAVFTVIIVLSQQNVTQAGPEVSRPVPLSLLPQTVGVAVSGDEAVLLSFEQPMDPASVEEALQLVPAHAASLSWNADRTELSVAPERRWRNDEAYLVVVDASATTADGAALATPRQFAFSTQTAPVVSDFAVQLAGVDLQEAAPAETGGAALRLEQNLSEDRTLAPDETARDVSPMGSIRIGFTYPMSRADVEERFTISPAVAGDLSWSGRDLIFTPSERLQPGGRYTISLAGAHDRLGNELGGKTNFSFLVRAAPEVVHTAPSLGALNVEPATVEMWFSQPMNEDATNAAFSLTDTTTGALVAGNLDWNEAGTQLVMTPSRAFAGGRTFEVALGAGAADAAGNPITAGWSFSTKEGPAPATPAARAATAASGGEARPVVEFVPGPASGLEGYGINQINAARAAYGFGPLYLDPTMSAVASAHAWDQLNYGYYSHSGRDGSSVGMRQAAAGVGFSAIGENQCHASMGMGAQGTMDWCHSVFMSEPWPGYPNHIGNILSSRYTRVGIGVADNGSRVVVTWDFAN